MASTSPGLSTRGQAGPDVGGRCYNILNMKPTGVGAVNQHASRQRSLIIAQKRGSQIDENPLGGVTGMSQPSQVPFPGIRPMFVPRHGKATGGGGGGDMEC